MIRWLIALPLLLFAAACAQLPELRPTQENPAVSMDRCTRIYPHGHWQFLHAIEADLPNGRRQTLMGLSQVSSEKRTGQFVMMTLEGLVLFEAHLNGELDIKRAVPPFDRPGMAAGIIEDLRLIFFSPGTAPIRTGTATDGATVCRFALPDGGTQDIVVSNEGAWSLDRYNSRGSMVRSVQPLGDPGLTGNGMAREILLEAPGPVGYRLKISLIEAKPLP